MNTLNRIFLKAKHWQLFILFFVLPLLMLPVLFVSILPGKAPIDEQAYIARLMGSMNWFYLAMLIINIIGGLWPLCVALGTRKLAPAETRKKTGFFIFSLIFAFAIPILMVWGFFSFFFKFIMTQGAGFEANPMILIVPLLGMLLVSLFASFCSFYCIYYTARAYKCAELQKSVKLDDYIVECVFFLFPFIGVWAMQPKINRMADEIMAAENAPAN